MRKRLPSLNALRTFEVAARHGSFKRAAAELCVSHSAISHQIKSLERYLGVELFLRKSRAVELSKIGQAYYPILRDAFDRIADGTDLDDPGVGADPELYAVRYRGLETAEHRVADHQRVGDHDEQIGRAHV